MVAKKLETKIRDALLTASRSHLPSGLFAQDSTGLSNLQRPRMYPKILISSVCSNRFSSTYPRQKCRPRLNALPWMDIPGSCL